MEKCMMKCETCGYVTSSDNELAYCAKTGKWFCGSVFAPVGKESNRLEHKNGIKENS